MTDERRHHHRHVVWFPIQVQTTIDGGDHTILGFSRDLSVSGVQFVAGARPEIGTEVTITITLPDDPEGARSFAGRIVRVVENEDDPEGNWRHRIGVEFKEAQADLSTLLSSTNTLYPPLGITDPNGAET